MATTGETSDDIFTAPGSPAKAEFGAVSAPVAVVAHVIPVPVSCVVVQPLGRFGVVTPSKLSKMPCGEPRTKLRFCGAWTPSALLTLTVMFSVLPQPTFGIENGIAWLTV